MGVRLDVTSLQKLRAQLERLEVQIADYDPLWADIVAIMVEHQAEWFASEGEGTWPPLAPSTIKQKAGKTTNVGPWREPATGPFPPDPLIRTGLLFEELQDPSAAEYGQGRSSLGTFTRKSLSWGTDDPVAEYHQEGREQGKTYTDPVTGRPTFAPGMPARPVIVITPELLQKVDDAQTAFIEQRVREAGLD